MRVMIVVTHLLGSGHLARAATLARAFSDAGHAALLVTGGRPAAHLDLAGLDVVQLPPLCSDGTDFSRLLRADGAPAGPDDFAARTQLLLDAQARFAPDVLITELFPFGRRVLRAEFTALLEAKGPRTRALCSIRDILAPPSKPAKAAFAAEMIATHYAGVLVHGDPGIAPLSLSWPVDPALEARLHYTGFIAPAPLPRSSRGEGILVSAGGGAVGDALFAAAIEAARLMPERPWRLCVGGDASRRAALQEAAPGHVTVEGLRRDFRAVLGQAAGSISMAGYNTTLDLLQSGTPAVLVPFDDGNEVEQTLRAKALSGLPAIATCPSAALSGPALAEALGQVLSEGPRPPRLQQMDGARASVEIVTGLAHA